MKNSTHTALRQSVSLAFVAFATVVCTIKANAVDITYTDANGVTWSYLKNNDGENTVTIGTSESDDLNDSSNGYARDNKTLEVSAESIPWKFTKDGVEYTVSRIGHKAFYSDAKLSGQLTFPDGLTLIRAGAFYGCSGLTGSLTFPDSLKRIGAGAFKNCWNLTGTLTIPDSVTAIGRHMNNGTFESCRGLTGVPKIGSGVTSIPNRFLYDARFTALVVHENVKTIRTQAFYCPKMVSALVKGVSTVESGTQEYTGIQLQETFYGSKLEFLLLGPNTEASSAVSYKNFLNNRATTVLYPDYPDNKTWAERAVPNFPESITAIPYGPGLDLDIAIDGNVLTATPTTETMLANVLTWASRIKNDFGMDTKVCITNPIPVVEGLVTADLLKKAEFGSLMFKVTSQAQLDTVLAATANISVPIGIDPDVADKHEMLSLPANRKVWVLLSGNGKYIPKVNGLVITFQ